VSEDSKIDDFAKQVASESNGKMSFAEAKSLILRSKKPKNDPDPTPKKQTPQTEKIAPELPKKAILESEPLPQKNAEPSIADGIIERISRRKTMSFDEKFNEHKEMLSRHFYSYLVENLFSDKTLSVYYQAKTTAYIFANYFESCNTLISLEQRFNEYCKRVDIAAGMIENMENFDRKLHFPYPYLDVTKTGKKDFSFIKTSKFLAQNKQWIEVEQYRKTPEGSRHTLNKLTRAFLNNRINHAEGINKLILSTSDKEEQEILVAAFKARTLPKRNPMMHN